MISTKPRNISDINEFIEVEELDELNIISKELRDIRGVHSPIWSV